MPGEGAHSKEDSAEGGALKESECLRRNRKNEIPRKKLRPRIRRRRTGKGFFCAVLLLALFAASPLFPYVRSLVVMQVWNRIQEKGSLLEDTIRVRIPGGGATKETDWYPFVMNFRADEGFSRWAGEEGLRLTILYNFPAFSLTDGCSRLYDSESSYYNSFYGAYLVQREEGLPYGFQADGSLEPAEVAAVPQYDYQVLVLGDFGCSSSEFVFDWQITGQQAGKELAGYGDWIVCSADLTVSGAGHKKRTDSLSYLQYGEPGCKTEADFAPVDMKGLLYGRYFPEEDVSVFFYVVAGNETICRQWEREILPGVRITFPDGL